MFITQIAQASSSVITTPVTGTIAIDQSTPGTTNAVQVTGSLPSGTNVIGHVITDSGSVSTVSGTVTANIGTTNGLALDTSVNSLLKPASTLAAVTSVGTVSAVTAITNALPAGTNLLGKVGIDQTTPGTTNAVSTAYIGSTAVSTGNGVSGAGVQRVVIASDQTAFAVTAAPNFKTRADTYTTTSSGTTVDASLAPVKSFTIAVKATGAVTSWSVVLECSMDNVNFSTVLTHSNVTPGDGQTLSSGTSLFPCLYFRSRSTALVLGGGTNVVATILGM